MVNSIALDRVFGRRRSELDKTVGNESAIG
jgi:hypothetical protein